MGISRLDTGGSHFSPKIFEGMCKFDEGISLFASNIKVN